MVGSPRRRSEAKASNRLCVREGDDGDKKEKKKEPLGPLRVHGCMQETLSTPTPNPTLLILCGISSCGPLCSSISD
jgi:hypothetical protein